MKKKVIGLFLIIAMSTSSIFPVYANIENVINIKVNGVLENVSLKTTVVNGTTMININDLPKIINVKVFPVDSVTSRVKNDSYSADITIDKNTFVFNGSNLHFTEAPFKEDNIVYVPLKSVLTKFGAKVDWEEKTKTILIDTGKKEVKLLELNQKVTENTIVLSYEEGLETAHNFSKTLRNLEDSRELLDEQIKDVKDSPAYSVTSLYLSSADNIRARRMVLKLENERKNIFENKIIVKDGIELRYRNNLTNIINYDLTIQQLEERIKLEKISFENTKLLFEVGMESKVNVDLAKQNLKKSETDLKNAELSYKKEKESLAILLGYSGSTDVLVKFDPKYSKIDDNVERQINVNTMNDPKLVIADREIEYQQFVKDTHTNDVQESEIEIDNNLAAAKRSYSDILSSYSEKAYTQYTNLKQLEEREKSLDIDLSMARTNYNTAVTNYEGGKATLFDVQSAGLKLINAEIEVYKNKITFDNAVFAYNKPYL